MKLTIFSPFVGVVLLGVGLVVGATDLSGQTLELFLSSLVYYVLPGIAWLVVLLVRTRFFSSKPTTFIWSDVHPKWPKVTLGLLTIAVWTIFTFLHFIYFVGIFGRTGIQSLFDAFFMYVVIVCIVLGVALMRYGFTYALRKKYPDAFSFGIHVIAASAVIQMNTAAMKATPIVNAIFTRVRVTGIFLYRQVQKNVWVHRACFAAVGIVLIYVAWTVTRPVVLSYSDIHDTYELMREGVPLDGPMVLRLPEGEDSTFARFNVSFTPDIQTYWGRTTEDGYLVFKLRKNLLENDFYSVTYTASDGTEYTQTFKAVQRPQIEVFEPSEGSIVGEDTILTLTFNRPMIPLEGLDRDYEMELPITIEPPTEGAFRWVSQRQLEFVPETRLQRASNYTVTIGENFRSSDGLVVPPATHTFTVLPPAFQGGQQTLRVQDPLTLHFNQPVDLDALTVMVRDAQDVLVDVEKDYASSVVYNTALEQKERVVDRSTVVVKPANESGRWNFDSTYSYSAENIRPLEGSLTFENIQREFKVQPLLIGNGVRSARTQNATHTYFDPQGVLRLRFSEPVSADLLEITGKGIARVAHVSPCEGRIAETACTQPVDKSIIEILFDESQFGFNESFEVAIGSVYDSAGAFLGNLQETLSLSTYEDLEIYEVSIPEKRERHSLDICSSNPLIAYDDETYTDLISTTQTIENFYRTGTSRYIQAVKSPGFLGSQPWCAGSYVTTIQYALLEDTEYTMTLSPTDVFGNTTSFDTNFKTPKSEKNESGLQKPWLDNLHRMYTVTTPDKTRYTYTAGNIDHVDVRLCKLDPAAMVRVMGTLKREEFGPGDCIDEKNFTLSLPGTEGPDYFQIDLANYYTDTRGQYVITVTNPDLDAQQYNNARFQQYYDHMYTSVTNLSLVEKRTNQIDLTREGVVEHKTSLLDSGNKTNLYWVTDLRTLTPVTGASIFVYKDTQPGEGKNMVVGASATTNDEGVARTEVVADTIGAYVIHGEDSAVVTDWGDDLSYASNAGEAEQVYLYTDRPIYRPGDDVSLKGIHRIGYDGSFEIYQTEDIILEVTDVRNTRLVEKTVQINEYGTLSETVVLPDDAPLGTYTIRAKTTKGIHIGYGRFSVEEYVGSPFEVTSYADQDEYIAGDTMGVTVDAQYFFGAPLPEGTVTYTVTTQDYFFDRSKDARFRFGGDWYHCWYCGSTDQFLTRGEGVLADGVFTFKQELDFDALFERDDDEEEERVERSKIFVVNATVTDGNGRSVSVQESFIVHRAERYVAVKSSNRLVENNTPTTIALKTVDTEGDSAAQEVEVRIQKREWKEFKRREVDGSFYTQSQLVRTEVARQSVVTDSSGYTIIPFVYPEPGQYEIIATGYDARGNVFSETVHQYVYGPESASVRHYNDRSLDIAVESTDLAIGERSKLIIQSPFESAKALITTERGSVIDYEIVDVNANYFDYDFVAKKEYAPNVVTSVVLLSGDPSVKYGTVRFAVDRQVHNLDISVSSNKEVYLPGEEVTLYVQTKDWVGNPVPAEVSVAAVDLSVLALKGNPEKDPLLHFYQGFPHSVITSANLKFVHEEVEIPTGTKGGGGNAEDLARRERGVFKDTAFWEAAVETDATGRAVVRFTLPDNLTRWRVETIGVTKDTKVGVNYMEFTERKDLITTPLTPRFVLPGDTVSLGAEILNRTDVAQSVTFTVETEGLALEANEQYGVIPPKSAKRFFVDLLVPKEVDSTSFVARFSAKNTTVEDTIVKTIPITDNKFFESVFLSGFTDGAEAVEAFYTPTDIDPAFGGVRVKAFSTVGTYLEDSVSYMATYPYGCSEQLASKIATLATAAYLSSLDNLGDEYSFAEIVYHDQTYTVSQAIQEGLTRIYKAQGVDGGFGYYYGLDSDIALSLHVVSVLQNLQDVDVAIDQKVLERAVAYIAQEANKRENHTVITNNAEWLSEVLVTAYNLRHIEPRPRAVDAAIQDIRTAITRKSVKIMSTHDLAYAALLSDNLWWFDRWNVWKEMKKRLHETPDGTYLRKYPGKIAKSYYETDVKNAALALRAIIETDRLEEEASDILRWLLAQRSGDGAWSTTNTTHEVVQTLAEYIVWKDEQHAVAVIELFLDGSAVGSHDPNTEPRLEGLQYEEGFEVLGTSTKHTLTFSQGTTEDRNDTMYYDVAMKYALDRDVLPARDEGVYVERHFYSPEDIDHRQPLTQANVGDLVVGRVVYTVRSPMRMVGLEDRIPAGFEIVNFDYATENKEAVDAAVARAQTAKENASEEIKAFIASEAYAALSEVVVYKDEQEAVRPSRRAYLKKHQSSFQELHDDRIFSFSEKLSPGVYVHEYYLRALVPGTYQHLPAQIGEMYDPSFFGRTEGATFTVLPKE